MHDAQGHNQTWFSKEKSFLLSFSWSKVLMESALMTFNNNILKLRMWIRVELLAKESFVMQWIWKKIVKDVMNHLLCLMWPKIRKLLAKVLHTKKVSFYNISSIFLQKLLWECICITIVMQFGRFLRQRLKIVDWSPNLICLKLLKPMDPFLQISKEEKTKSIWKVSKNG